MPISPMLETNRKEEDPEREDEGSMKEDSGDEEERKKGRRLEPGWRNGGGRGKKGCGESRAKDADQGGARRARVDALSLQKLVPTLCASEGEKLATQGWRGGKKSSQRRCRLSKGAPSGNGLPFHVQSR